MTTPTDIVAPQLAVTDSGIDATREAFLASFPEDPSAVETAATEVVAPEAPAPVAEVEATPSEVAPEAKESEARSYRKLLAREAKLREDAKALETDKAAVAEFKKLQSRAKADTVGYLRSLGLSQPEIMSALAEAQIADLGDLAPSEARVQLAARKTERLHAEMEEKLAAQTAAATKAIEEREAQHFIQQYQAGITSFVAGTELAAFPELARVAAAGKPVAQAIWQTALEISQANPTGPAPTYAQVAAHLNSQLAELASVVSAPTPTASVPATPPVMAAQKPVLRNSSTQAQPSPAPEPEGLSYNELRERIRKQVFARYAVE